MSFEPTQVLPDEQDVASFSSESSAGEHDQEECESVPALMRGDAVAGKRPRVCWEHPEEEEVDEEALLGPDLADYFATFGLAHESQIAMCRTYANYLAALTRPKKYTSRKV